MSQPNGTFFCPLSAAAGSSFLKEPFGLSPAEVSTVYTEYYYCTDTCSMSPKNTLLLSVVFLHWHVPTVGHQPWTSHFYLPHNEVLKCIHLFVVHSGEV